MINEDNGFEKLSKQVKMEEEKYLNAEVTIENYKFPHIYLTDEEIKQFNKDCEQYDIDIKVVPLTTYMNLNSPDKSLSMEEDDENDMEIRERNIDDFMNHLGKNFHIIEEKKENKYIGKKRIKVLDDNSEEEEEEEKSMKSSVKDKSFISNKSNNSDKNNAKDNDKENKDKKQNLQEKSKVENKKDDESAKKKKLNKKKKHHKKPEGITDNFQNYFRKIKETRQKQEEDEQRKGDLIKEIKEKSQLLTPDDLKEVAKVHRIGLFNNNLSDYDLQRKEVIQLDRVLVDININSNVNKLNSGDKADIKTMHKRQEREKKSKEEEMENRRMKELKKQKENESRRNNQNQTEEEKKENDSSDNESESDSEQI